MSEEQSNPRFNSVQVVLLSFIVSLIFIVGAGLLLLVILNQQDQEPTSITSIDGVTVIAPPETVQDFTMASTNGDPLSLSDLQGQLLLIAFGYTHCPDVCPATLLDFKRIKEALGDDADRLQFVFISVDAQRDTPEVLDRYIERYDEEFIGLSATVDELERISPDFSLHYTILENPDSSTNYLVEHTATRYLIDEQGQLIRIYSFSTQTDAIVEDLRRLL